MPRLLRALLVCSTLAATQAVAKDYKVEFNARVGSIEGEKVPLSCKVRITHDVFFGEPTVRATAGACERPDGTPLKTTTLYACYDVVQGDTTRATRCEGPLIEVDVAGSPNWGQLFPGLTASEAKALVKAGFTIANVRLSAKPIKPGATATASTPSGASAPVEPSVPAPGVDPVDAGASPAAAAPSTPCTPPSLSSAGGPWAACVTPMVGSTNQAVLTADGVRHGLHPTASEVEWRRQGDSAWSSVKDANLLARPTLGPLEPCRTWEVRARTYCDDGSVSEWTSTALMRTSCPTPSHLRVEPAGPRAATVSWRRPAGHCMDVEGTAAEVQLATAIGPWAPVVPLDNGRLVGLAPATSYSVRVRFTFPGGTASPWEKASFTTSR